MVIAVRSQDATMLPIRDVLLPTPTGSSSQVGVQPGPVLFSGDVEAAPIGMELLYAAGTSSHYAYRR